MFRPRIIPVLNLMGKGLVKTVGFNKKKAKYIGDPINAVRIFNDLESDELVFLDITASQEKRTISTQLVKDIGDEAYMPFAVGGGITKPQQAEEIIKSGAEKVVICSAAYTQPHLIKDIATHFGHQSVIVCMDIKKNLFGTYKLMYNGGEKTMLDDIIDFAKRMEEQGAGELMINAIDLDGTMKGYDIGLIQRLSKAVSIPVVACGGAGHLDHIKQVVTQGGAHAAGAGSLFVFHGPRNAVLVNYPDKKELLTLFKEIYE